MNITSMLSESYLQPATNNNIRRAETVQPSPAASSAQAQQEQILAKEQGLKESYGPEAKVSTTYRYSFDPDGNRYISGAYVSIESDGQTQKTGMPEENQGGKHYESRESTERSNENDRKADSGASKDAKDGLSPEQEAAVQELRRVQQEVITHEAAHQAAGGGLAGAASYSYTQGPDGKSYVTGGEVSIQMPVSDNPEQTIRDMAQVQRAAMAPASPSSQDVRVAAKAASMAANARQELASKTGEPVGESNEKPALSGSQGTPGSEGVSSVKAGLLFSRLNEAGYTIPDGQPDSPDPIEAYGRSASDRGLWTLSQGFEQIPQMIGMWPISRFETAA